MDRIDFLGFALLLRDMSGLDRYSTRQSKQGSHQVSGLSARILSCPCRSPSSRCSERIYPSRQPKWLVPPLFSARLLVTKL